ncbi:MAG TPA: hypothetical protein VD932_08945, partial [Aquabacterium sp.]|nr:hypothetical protein [Aquabacterium sp.]
MPERTARPHEFWLETCGLDTHKRGTSYARLDTPWNAFTADCRALVCTLWVDFMVDVHDRAEGRVRRFVKMGGRSRRWKGIGIQHGQKARENLDKAIAEKLPVFGYEAEPNAAALDRGERAVKHFYLDRAHQLKPWIGLSRHDLEQRLHIEDAFRQQGLAGTDDPNLPSTLFELVDATVEVPGARTLPSANGETSDEADELQQRLEGNRSADEYAPLALSLLVAHVLQQTDAVLEPITYLRLAELLGRRNKHGEPWARGLGHVLGRVTALIESVSSGLLERPPFLTSVVVLSRGADAGLPDKGVRGVWPGYESLSREEKQTKVAAECQRVLRYGSNWNEVLRLLGLPAITPSFGAGGGPVSGGWAGGESEDHKALKRFVFEHPELVGAGKDWPAWEEYPLRSLDELDVMFRSDRLWIGVEVKSKVSDRAPGDY